MLRELIVLLGSGLIAWKVSEYVSLKYLQKFLDQTNKYNKEIVGIVIKELDELRKIKHFVDPFVIEDVDKKKLEELVKNRNIWVTSVDIDDDVLEEE